MHSNMRPYHQTVEVPQQEFSKGFSEMAVEHPCLGRNIESIPGKHAQVMGLWNCIHRDPGGRRVCAAEWSRTAVLGRDAAVM